jgi:hypothetical protein
VEGRSLRLTGSAEEQYREWRRLLREYQMPDGAVDATTTSAADSAVAPAATAPPADGPQPAVP